MSEAWERTPRRMHCLCRIRENGDRQLFEFAWNVANGMPLDVALEFFAGFDPADCRAADVADLPVGRLRVVGGRR
jgi:hypothetical protein